MSPEDKFDRMISGPPPAPPVVHAGGFETSSTVGKLAAALAKAQGEMENAAKDAINPHFGKSYADLAGIINAVRLALAKNGIARHQAPLSQGDLVGVRTTLMHDSGEWLAGTCWCKPDRPGAQALGSVITYLRRYSLAAACGIAQEDDDGNAATGKGPDVYPLDGSERPKGDAPRSAPRKSSPSAPRAASGAKAPANSTNGHDDPLEELRRLWTKNRPDGLQKSLSDYGKWMSETFPVKRGSDMNPQQVKDAYSLTYALIRGEAAYQTELAGMWAAGRKYGPDDLPEEMGGAPGPKVAT